LRAAVQVAPASVDDVKPTVSWQVPELQAATG
jgi:hypothetical protein